MHLRQTVLSNMDSKDLDDDLKPLRLFDMLNYQNYLTDGVAAGKTRKTDSEKLEKLQKDEKTRNDARRKAQKKGVSISTDKPKLKNSKLAKPPRKSPKKRVSVR